MTRAILVVDDSSTLRQVVARMLVGHGFEPVVVASGAEALRELDAAPDRFSLVLLDFVMPEMNGFELARAIRGRGRGAGVPLVLMSAKSDRIRDAFMAQTGAVDAISKPFGPEALRAVVDNALRRVESGRFSSTTLPISEPDPSAIFERIDVDDGGEEPVAEAVARQLRRLVRRTLREASSSDPEAVARRITERLLRDASLPALVDALQGMDDEARGPVALAGRIGVVPIGAVLQVLEMEQLTGTLSFTTKGRIVRAYFRQGRVDLVESRGAASEFRLGRYFVEQGLVSPDDIETLLAQSEEVATVAPDDLPPRTVPTGPPEDTDEHAPVSAVQPVPLLGDMLLSAGLVQPADLARALERQASELLYDVMRWTSGRFSFRVEEPSPLADRTRLGLHLAHVVMEGIRRVDEWRVIETILGDFDDLLHRDEHATSKLDRAALSRAQLVVLDALGGSQRIRDVVRASHLSSFDACHALAQFLEARVVRRERGSRHVLESEERE